jgi:hypothetical protein
MVQIDAYLPLQHPYFYIHAHVLEPKSFGMMNADGRSGRSTKMVIGFFGAWQGK